MVYLYHSPHTLVWDVSVLDVCNFRSSRTVSIYTSVLVYIIRISYHTYLACPGTLLSMHLPVSVSVLALNRGEPCYSPTKTRNVHYVCTVQLHPATHCFFLSSFFFFSLSLWSPLQAKILKPIPVSVAVAAIEDGIQHGQRGKETLRRYIYSWLYDQGERVK